jgi:hypothetical protein
MAGWPGLYQKPVGKWRATFEVATWQVNRGKGKRKKGMGH